MAVGHRWFDREQGGWSIWEKKPTGNVNSGPGVSSWAEGRLDVFALLGGNKLKQRYYKDGWSHSWRDMQAPSVNSDPDAVSWGYRRIDVFIRGTDNHLWHRSY